METHSSSGVAATYLLTGPLRTSVKLAMTQIPSAEPKFAPEGTQRIRIVDMDEMSDDERNSEDGAGDPEAVAGGLWTADDEENGPGGEDAVVGNDEGDAIGGISGKGVEAVKLEKGSGEVVRPEEVQRWGVVLVQQDALEGEHRESLDISSIGAYSPQRRRRCSQKARSTCTSTRSRRVPSE